MKKLIVGVALLVLAGCGDTVNQVAPVAAQNKLTIKAATFSVYSSRAVFDHFSSNASFIYKRGFDIQGTIGYDGDPQGVIMMMTSGDTHYHADYGLTPGKNLAFDIRVEPSEIQKITGQPFTCILTDPHGNDSNAFPMTLIP